MSTRLLLTLLAVPLVAGLLAAGLLVLPLSEGEGATRLFEGEEEAKRARIVFVGDIMLDRYIRRMMEFRGPEHVLGGVRELLVSPDLTIGNLEGPITDQVSVSSGTKVGDISNMRFTFATSSAPLLAEYGFDLVSIGNNHMRDFGVSGVESTKWRLDEAGIAFVGDPLEISDEPVIKEVNGIKIAFVGFNEFLGADPVRTVQAIRDAERAEADAVIVLAHWGDEYIPDPPERVRARAREFVGAGADLIVGTHSHVRGIYEDIGSARVYYSLGNFVFDQYWDKEVRCGTALGVVLTKKGNQTRFVYEETDIGMSPDGRTAPGCS